MNLRYSAQALLLACFITLQCSAFSFADVPDKPSTDALAELITGNQRFFNNTAQHPHQNHQRLIQLSHGQHPFVAILACSDSRIAPELIFDQGLGDIFDIRVAGNIVDKGVLGSIEYAVEHLNVPLIIVLGHQHCGAIEAALAHEHPHNDVNFIIHSLAPAVRQSQGSVDLAVKFNVEQVVKNLEHVKSLKEFIENGSLTIVGAYYNLETGQVELLHSTRHVPDTAKLKAFTP